MHCHCCSWSSGNRDKLWVESHKCNDKQFSKGTLIDQTNGFWVCWKPIQIYLCQHLYYVPLEDGRNIGRGVGKRYQGAEMVNNWHVTKTVTAMGNWSLILLGNSGRSCRIYLRVNPPRVEGAGVCVYQHPRQVESAVLRVTQAPGVRKSHMY